MNIQITYPKGKTKALTFSYDDNQIHDRKLIEMMNKYELFGTFHINSGFVNLDDQNNAYINYSELKDLYKNHEVACHGVTHPYFNQLAANELQYEILEDKRMLENSVGYIIRGMSYPFGIYSDEIIEVAKSTGIEYSRTVESTGFFGWPTDFMKWHPTCHQDRVLKSRDLVDLFINAPVYLNLPLLYIWGHSFEFTETTWEDMDKLCKTLSGHSDVWYATNIQIKDYISAIRNLIRSADQSIIYNPSAITVYFMFDNKLEALKAGETWQYFVKR